MKNGKKYILVADDDREIREIVSLLLSSEELCSAICELLSSLLLCVASDDTTSDEDVLVSLTENIVINVTVSRTTHNTNRAIIFKTFIISQPHQWSQSRLQADSWRSGCQNRFRQNLRTGGQDTGCFQSEFCRL